MERSGIHLRMSKILHRVGDVTSRSSVAMLVTVVVVAALVFLAVSGFPADGEAAFSVAVSAVTVVMLFVIQHTQSRQQSATQLKLDELIRTSPDADDLLVHIELADDVELIERESDQIAHHESLRETDVEIEHDD